MKKIKIVNILEESRFGGPHERIITIANILKKKTNTIIIAPKKNNDLFKKKMKKKKLNFIFLNTQTLQLNVRSIIFYIFFFFSDILKLRRNIKKLNPDIIHVSGGAWQFRSILASLNLKSKILWHLNDSKSNFFIIIIFFFC